MILRILIYSYSYNKQVSTEKDKCWSRSRCIVCRNQRCLVTRIIHHGRGDSNNFEQKQHRLANKMYNYWQSGNTITSQRKSPTLEDQEIWTSNFYLRRCVMVWAGIMVLACVHSSHLIFVIFYILTTVQDSFLSCVGWVSALLYPVSLLSRWWDWDICPFWTPFFVVAKNTCQYGFGEKLFLSLIFPVLVAKIGHFWWASSLFQNWDQRSRISLMII